MPLGGERVSPGRQSGQDTGTPGMPGGKIGGMMAAAKQMQQASTKPDEVAINIDEKKPLIANNKDETVVTVSTVGQQNRIRLPSSKCDVVQGNSVLYSFKYAEITSYKLLINYRFA
jgi:hypothetical protein